MEIIITIFNELLYRPLFNALILLYNWLPGRDFGIAIMLLTLSLRVILFPLTRKAIVAQKKLSELQPKLKELQKKHRENKETQAKAMMEFYKTQKVNPLGGCLPLLLQFPILIALYRVLLGVFNSMKPEIFYSFVAIPQHLNPMFLSLINLSERSMFLAALAGISQFIYSKITIKTKGASAKEGGGKPDFQKMMGTQMTYFMPILTVFIAMSLPAGLALYWAATTIFSIIEYQLIKTKSSRPAESGGEARQVRLGGKIQNN